MRNTALKVEDESLSLTSSVACILILWARRGVDHICRQFQSISVPSVKCKLWFGARLLKACDQTVNLQLYPDGLCSWSHSCPLCSSCSSAQQHATYNLNWHFHGPSLIQIEMNNKRTAASNLSPGIGYWSPSSFKVESTVPQAVPLFLGRLISTWPLCISRVGSNISCPGQQKTRQANSSKLLYKHI